MASDHDHSAARRVLPKMMGADIELAGFVEGRISNTGSGFEAARAILARIEGHAGGVGDYYTGWNTATAPRPASSLYQYHAAGCAVTNQWLQNSSAGRRYLAENASCFYEDHGHVEACIPEVLSAFDHAAAWHACLRIVRKALDAANAARPDNRRIVALANSSDGLGQSYGAHLNFLVSRHLLDDLLLMRKPHYLHALATFQISAILLTGIGKVGNENGHPQSPYNIAQRADFMETMTPAVQTTFKRPIVNGRDEALCGKTPKEPDAPARYHCIFFDSALSPGSCIFRAGLMQMFLAQLEAGFVNPLLLLNDPLAALHAYSADPTLQTRAALVGGEQMTLVELQFAFLEDAKRHAAEGLFDGVVPEAERILALWEETLLQFQQEEWMKLARRIDWVLKLVLIERAMEQRPELDWDSDEVKMMDHLYSSLDEDGLYFAHERAGFIDRLVPEERIAHFLENPPSDTRAWTRAQLLRRAVEEGVTVSWIDWDGIGFKLKNGRTSWPTYRAFQMANPLGLTEAEAQPVFDSAENFSELLDGLEELASGDARTEVKDQIQNKGEETYAHLAETE